MSSSLVSKMRVIDSHTGGEPTRIIVEGGPDLGNGPMSERREIFRQRADRFRVALVCEPRGSGQIVGALLCSPSDPTCEAGVIFFNNVGYLGMCGHGTIGLMVTLSYMNRLKPGAHRIETPVGVVTAELSETGAVSVSNVVSYRHLKRVTVDVPGYGPITGDVAWGGNWFFLVEKHGQELHLGRVEQLTRFTWQIRQALERSGITGRDGQMIDHIELFGPPRAAGANSRNFVLCPGMSYDRSPCGTGTSAKLACLFEEGKLAAGQVWKQEGIVGSMFDGWVRFEHGEIRPTIRGTAFVNADTTVILDERDPFCWGLPA